MAKDILSKEAYTLKLSKEDSKDLTKFCIISVPIYDAVNSALKELKAIESYLKEWRELEKPMSKIIGRLK